MSDGSFKRRVPPTDGRYVAARTIDFGDRVIAEGENFPWQEMGLDSRDVQRRWWSGELEAAPLPADDAKTMTALVTPTASVVVPTPKQQRSARK